MHDRKRQDGQDRSQRKENLLFLDKGHKGTNPFCVENFF